MANATPLASQDILAFRTAADLCSSEPSQLRKTIEKLEGRISSQDELIERQLQYIQELERTLEQRQTPHSATDNSEMDELKEKNKRLEEAQERLQDGFDTLFHVEIDNLENSLEMLEKLPDSPEARSLYVRCKKQSRAISRAKDLGQASPLNALRQMADLEKDIVQFIIGRPLLTFTRSDRYRAEVLLATLSRNAKPISTLEASRIIGEAEGKTIDPKQALRAMRWVANSHPDQAKFEKRGARRKAWLCKVNSKEPRK
jgi:small-conductance mechanosensitive channel